MSLHRNDQGFTFVELIIAIVIGLILISSVTATYIAQNRSYVIQESVSEVNTQSKIAHDLIANELKSAGFGRPDDMNIDPVNGFTTIITPVDNPGAPDAITIVGGLIQLGTLWPVGGAPGMACPASVPLGSTVVQITFSGIQGVNITNNRSINIDGVQFASIANCTINNGICNPAPITLDRPLAQDFPLVDTNLNNLCNTGRPVYLVEDTTFCVDANSVLRRIRLGANVAELFMKKSKGISVEAKDGKVEAFEASKDIGIALRVIKNKRLGFSFTTDPDDIKNTVQEAIQGAEWTAPDEFVNIPEYLPANEAQVYDNALETIKEEDLIRDALFLEEKTMNFDKRIQKVRKAETEAGTGDTTIVNSRGINTTYRSSYYSASVGVLARDDSGDNQMGWDYASSRRKEDIDLKLVGERASGRAIDLLGSRKISAVKVPVILSPSVAVDFLGILSASLSAESVQKQRSFLAGKIEESIISPVLNIIDDGMRPWGIASRPVDDEGVPTQKKILLAEGRLNSYIHNSYTANKDGVSSTGNAVRGGSKSLPGVGVTNIYIEPSKGVAGNGDDLVRVLSKGIVILSAMGVHMANPVSGEFSIGISGLWVENGETVYPVKEAVISGNILEMFKKVEAVGGDLEFYGNAGSPGLLIGDMDISA